MSDPIKHECGIALLRLKKPLQYYLDKYGTAFYAINKMNLLMEKQVNRGQDGAGLANIKKIMSTKVPGDKPVSSSGVPSIPTASSFDPTAALAASSQGQTQSNQITLGNQTGSTGANVVKAYVVSSEMSSQQEADRKITDLARL